MNVKTKIEIIDIRQKEIHEDIDKTNDEFMKELIKAKDKMPDIELIVDEAENYLKHNIEYKFTILNLKMSENEVEIILRDTISSILNNLNNSRSEFTRLTQLLDELEEKNKEIRLLLVENRYEIDKLDI